MEKKARLATATDWKAEIKNETRQEVLRSICAKLKEGLSSHYPNGMNLERFANLAMEHEKKLFKNSKSEEMYLNAFARKTSTSENRLESASSQGRPTFSSDQSVLLTKKEDAFVIQPSPQMSNQPHQWAVPNPLYQQPADPNSLLQQHTQQLTPKPHGQLQRQKLNVRQTHQQFEMHNQSCVNPQNALNSPCGPQGLESRDFETYLSPEIFTQNPNVVNLQPNENLTTQVKEEVIGEAFQASKFSHQHRTAIEQHKQHQSMGASAVPNGIPNSEDWHHFAFAQMEQLKKICLPLFKRAREQYMQVEQTENTQHHLVLLHKMMIFLQLPRDRIIATYTKEEFYRNLRAIVKSMKAFENRNINLANKQQPLHGQPGLSGYRINPVQQRDNVKLHFQPVNWATNVSPDSSSPIAPRETGSVKLEADWTQNNLLQNRQHSENTKQEFRSQRMQLKQKSTENIQAINRSGMSLKHHLNSKFSPQIHEASQLSQIAERALPVNPCASLHGRASPTPPSSVVGLGYPQHCNFLELPHPKTEIELQSHMIRSSSASNSPPAEPAKLESNRQLPTATQPLNRLLTAVESMSNEALRVVGLKMNSVVNMEDSITEPWCYTKATHLRSQDGCGSSNNMKRKINATALKDMPSPCSDTAGSEPAVISKRKKLKKLSDYALLEEIRNINKQFIETVLELDLDKNLNRRLANAGTVLRCSYSAITGCKNSEAHPLKLPVLSVKLLVPLDYPEDYPVFLSKFNTDCGNVDEKFRDLSYEATSRLRAFLRTAPDCLSLVEYARAWDECARSVVHEYAQRAGGGCFSTRYGTWEDCITTA